MERTIKRSRIITLAVILLALLVVYGTAIYKLQIIEGEKYLEASSGYTAVTTKVYATRGSVLDRDGELMVSDRPAHNVYISRSSLLSQEDPSGLVLRLVKAAREYGVHYTDTFPVTRSAPFSYTAAATSTQKSRLEAYFEYFDLDPEMSATDFISWLRDHYKIDFTVTAEDARLIIGVRYEVEIRAIVRTTDYVFAEDVSTDFVTHILENDYPCVNIETTSVRQYHTDCAAHLLGYIGPLTSDEYEMYKDQGYSLNSYIGKNGVEYAFESYLRGTDGVITTYYDSNGAIVDVEVVEQARAGCNVYLTIDTDLQETLEDTLSTVISQMNIERTNHNATNDPEEEDYELAEGAAGVVIDVRTGDVLALASYPTYDLSTFYENYSVTAADPLKPFTNRATHGRYNPGSTFKMVTVLTALNLGVIDPDTIIEDKGIYTEYEDQGFTPRCWIYTGIGSATHGWLDAVGALENSCNYFIYSISDRMDITPIAETARTLGLGQETGVEIGETAGVLATREYKREVLGEGWWNADTLLTAIGQGHNLFTPIQMANYVATLANGGTHYELTVLNFIASSDYAGVVLEEEPTVLNVLEDPNGYISVIQKGMRAVASTGTASSVFSNFEIPVAAKTGTVQSDSASMNTGVFVCYAPADNPQIAIALVVEKGGSGAALTGAARDILTQYFLSNEASTLITGDNQLAH